MSKHDIVTITPPATVAGMTVFGYSVNEWILWGTLVYTAFILIDKLPVVIARIKQFLLYLRSLNHG